MKPQPSFADPSARISHWLASLEALEALRPTIVVPSHGPFGDASLMRGYRDYLTRIRDRTDDLRKAGKTESEVIETITAEMSGEFTDRGRLAGAIRAAFAESGPLRDPAPRPL